MVPSSENRDEKQLVVLAGLSGAGRSVAAGAFEDLGWFVIDNLPVFLVPKIAELATAGAGGRRPREGGLGASRL